MRSVSPKTFLFGFFTLFFRRLVYEFAISFLQCVALLSVVNFTIFYTNEKLMRMSMDRSYAYAGVNESVLWPLQIDGLLLPSYAVLGRKVIDDLCSSKCGKIKHFRCDRSENFLDFMYF